MGKRCADSDDCKDAEVLRLATQCETLGMASRALCKCGISIPTVSFASWLDLLLRSVSFLGHENLRGCNYLGDGSEYL